MSEVGEAITFHDNLESIKTCEVEIIMTIATMTIATGRRRLELYKPETISPAYNQYIYNKQAEIIKAFMEEG